MTTQHWNSARPRKLVVTYEIQYGRPAEAGTPNANPVEHRGTTVHAVYEGSETVVFTYPPDATEAVYAKPAALKAAAHKGLKRMQQHPVPDDLPPGVDPDYFIPMYTEVASVEAR